LGGEQANYLAVLKRLTEKLRVDALGPHSSTAIESRSQGNLPCFGYVYNTGGSELASPMGSFVSVSGDAVSACALRVATAFAAALRRFLVLAALPAVARRLRVLAALLAVARPFRVFAAFFAAARRFRVTADFLADDEAIYQLLCRRSASATLNRHYSS